MLRRQLGYVVEKAVQTQNLAFHAAYADKIERIFSQIRRHFAALEQRGYVVGYTRVEIADSVAQTRRVLDEHDGVLRQIVERGRHFGINERHILVRCGQRTGLAQTFRVPFEVSLQICVLLLSAGRGECQNSLCQSCRTALRQCRNGFHTRQTAQALALLHSALTADVERGDRVDFIIPKFHAVRVLRLRRKHIEDTAANGKLTGAFDLYAALVACARE